MNTEPTISGSKHLVEVKDLKVTFASRDSEINAVNGVSFNLDPGEVLCILGESGSGKSVTMRALMRLLPKNTARISGQITIEGRDVVAMSDNEISDLRGPVVSMIFQEPMTAFDPVFTIGQQIAETIVRHEGISQTDAMARALELLDLVQIPSAKSRLNNYPFEMSGGMRQRAMIALALSCRPSLLLADEPTTALDATVQIQILLLLRKLRDELGMAIMFVTHDIGVAVEVEQVAFGDIRDQFKTAAPAGEGPDIMAGAHDWLGELAVSGLLAEVDLGGKESEFVENAIDALTYDGTLYGMPYQTQYSQKQIL